MNADWIEITSSPSHNVRIGPPGGTVWSTSPVTGLPAQGVVAIGSQTAGVSTESKTFNGTFSVHVGHLSGGESAGGYCQTAAGLRTLRRSVGAYNAAFGTDALKDHIDGDNQVAVGAKAMLSDITGYSSFVGGTGAAYSAVSVVEQVIIGDSAAYGRPLGPDDRGNVLIGRRASYARTGGLFNVEIGESAGDVARRVDYCTHIGRGSGRDTPDGTSLAGAIGYDASPSGSSRFRIGGSGVVPEAGASLQVISDKRDKVHVGELPLDKARAVVLGAAVVEYRTNPREAYDLLATDDDEKAHREGAKAGKRVHAGVYAQDEFERLASLGIDFAGLQHAAVKHGRDQWTAAYEAYVPHLICIIIDQERRIAALEARLAADL